MTGPTRRSRLFAAARVSVAMVLAVAAGLSGCAARARPEAVPIVAKGYCYLLYDVKGWNADSIRKAWGPPTRIIRQRKDFAESINHKAWNHFGKAEVRQWVYLDKSGMESALVTFDAKGNALRAIREWSDF